MHDPEWYKATGVPYDDQGHVPADGTSLPRTAASMWAGSPAECAIPGVEKMPDGRKVVIAGA